MKEEFLQYIWANSLYRTDEFETQAGKLIRILDVGKLNRDAGPDFFNARIVVGKVMLAGNIEIHLRSSDWYRHSHHLDAAYNNVILSVVKENDTRVYTSSGREVDCIVIEYADYLYHEYLFMRDTFKRPGCYRHLDLLDDNWFYITLQSLAIERLERKVNDIRKIFGQTNGDWEECFYRLLCKYWSADINSDTYYQLSCHLSYKMLLRYADRLLSVEALLLGVSGLLDDAPEDHYSIDLKREYWYLSKKHKLWEMPSGQWKFMRIRPGAFPTLRLALLAAMICHFNNLLSYVLEAATLKEVFSLFEVKTSAYWNTHYMFGKESAVSIKSLGVGSRRILIINVVIPYLFFYGRERGEEKLVEKALQWMEEIKPENNYIVRSWGKYGFAFDSALHTQALIQLRKEYCDKHDCLRCRIGREIFARLRH